VSKLLMLAGGIVEPGVGQAGAVSAYVALNAGRSSRLFKVQGPASAPVVTELDAATTVDVNRFRQEVAEDVAPALAEIRSSGGAAAVAVPSARWVADVVRRHLSEVEGTEVD
jgi:hypothetical protein